MNDVQLIKTAASMLQNRMLKKADLGYVNGPWYELSSYIGRHIPVAMRNVGKFMHANSKPFAYAGLALGGYALAKYLWNKNKRKYMDRNNEIRDEGVPADLAPDTAVDESKAEINKKNIIDALKPSKQQIADTIVNNQLEEDVANAAVAGKEKKSACRLVNVLGYMYR